METKKTVLSGIRATGKLHLGNYLGALCNFVDLSRDEDKECLFFIANLHTLTTKIKSEEIMHDLDEIVMDFISVGIDIERSTIFAQSSVPETCELNWLLACMTPVSDLERMPHFKDKKDSKKSSTEFVNAGLLTYPVLMAADILGPRADIVPVGEDQHPHVELTRELARRFNNLYGETFPIPDFIEGESIRVPGLDGTEKMGKSDQNTIELSDSPEMITQKIKRAMTDPARKRLTDFGDPNKCNMYYFHQLINSGDNLGEIIRGCRNAKIGCVDCKKIISDKIISILTPIQERRKDITRQGNKYIREILHEGGLKAREIISNTVSEVKEKMGVPNY